MWIESGSIKAAVRNAPGELICRYPVGSYRCATRVNAMASGEQLRDCAVIHYLLHQIVAVILDLARRGARPGCWVPPRCIQAVHPCRCGIDTGDALPK